MADDRTFNVEDRIRELGEDPATAYANAKANGMAGDAPPPTALPAQSDPLSSPEYPPPAGVGAAPGRIDPFDGKGGGIVDDYQAPQGGAPGPQARTAPDLAPVNNTGTLADSLGRDVLPDFNYSRPVTQPLEPAASFGELFTANRHAAERDSSMFDQNMLHDGYAPIVQMLGLPPSENPANFNQTDENVEARFGSLSSPSNLATAAKQGEQMPSGNVYLADRPLQESLIAAAIKQHRATDPNFAPGVPDTVPGLHAFFAAQQKKLEAVDNAVIARSPGGLTGFGAALAGSTVGTFKDPVNLAALAIPGGEGAGLLRIAARDALINGVIELGEQPIVAHNKAELGDRYTAADAAASIASAAAGGAILGPALHVGGRAVGSTIGTVSDLFKTLPEAVRTKWAGRVDGGEPASSFFSGLSNHELTDFARDVKGNQLTPDETAAANVLERSEEVGATSPYQPGPVGDGTHDISLALAIKDLDDHRTPEVAGFPSVPAADGSGAASPAAVLERPRAPSTVARPQPPGAPADPETAIQSFIGKVGHAENATGDVNAKNPHSSASGPAQFTDGTFRDYYRRVYGQDPGAHPEQALKNNPQVQGRLLDALTRDNAAKLQSLGESVNDGNLYLMHFLGSGDGAKVFKADPSAPIGELVPESVLAANPFLRGKSASEVIAWAHGKMGAGHIASVRAGAGPLEAATEDPTIAQLNADALQLNDAVIAADSSSLDMGPLEDRPAASAESPAMPPMYIRTYPASDIHVDAERFQFKSGGDANGVTDRLQGVTQWNPMHAGLVTTWEDNSGRVWIADGHQRHGLAMRIQEQTGAPVSLNAIGLREADGVTAEDARTYGALKNLAEQDTRHPTGSQLVDAAKVARGMGPEALLRALPPKSALARDGAALARLSDHAFGAVYNEVVPADLAAVIGHLLPDHPEAHEAMIDLLKKLDPANRSQAASLVRQAMAIGIHKEEQVDLFGAHEHVTTLMLEKAKVYEKIVAELRKMRLVHKTAAEGADALEAAGSSIAVERSVEEAKANAQAIETISRLAYRAGPVADAINDAARELAGGAKLGTVARAAAERIRNLDLAELTADVAARPDGSAVAGEASADHADSFNFDGPGRGGAAREEGAQPSAERGDPEQPSLHELEQATDRFSDPDGKAVQQQAQSLYHDLKASAVSRREKIQAATAALEGRGELRTVEPFPEEEPGYHRFRYLTRDGEEVTGNYTVDGNLIEGFNIGDANNPKELGPKELLRLFGQIQEQHPEVKYVHAYRKSGARTAEGGGEQEIWMELTGKGIKQLDGPPSAAEREISPQAAGNAAPARENDASGTGQPNPEKGAPGASEGLPAAERPNLVVDGEGKPLVVYRGEHGTGHNGEIQSRLGSTSFTADRKVAETYANHPNDRVNDRLAAEPRTIEATIDIRKPVMNDPEDPFIDGGTIERALGRDAAIEAALEHSGAIEDTSNWQEEINAKGEYADVRDFLAKHPDRVGELYFDAYQLFDDPKWVERFKAAGYDGAIHGGNGESALTAEYKVFDKSQIHRVGGAGALEHADQAGLTFRVGDEGGEISAADLLKDLDDDDKAIKAIKDCL